MADIPDDDEEEEKPESLLDKYKKTNYEALGGRIPTMEELFRATAALHDADKVFLEYLRRSPSVVRLIETMGELAEADKPPGTYTPEPKPLMERIKDELRRRKNEKGGELLP